MTIALAADDGERRDIELARAYDVGSPVDSVDINIDYAIIKHFSEHLYSSPNKAIEELVSNGFDALATQCYVYVPGEHVQNRVVVWDNGMSMDVAGIQAMWKIAKSPKDELGPDRVVAAEGGRQRAVIGKFGIGKLASYAVGHRISHICRTSDDRYLAVSVNYREFTDGAESAPAFHGSQVGSGAPEHIRTDIRELTREQADELVRSVLPTGGRARRATWTTSLDACDHRRPEGGQASLSGQTSLGDRERNASPPGLPRLGGGRRGYAETRQ